MKDTEQKVAAKRFAKKWEGRGYEKGDSQKFWLSLLSEVYGVEHPAEFISFEDQVHLDHTSFIDGFIPSTKVLIEQKGLGKDLNAPIKQSDGTMLNPFQQAKRYITELPVSKHPRWVVTCNFAEFYVYDMERPGGEPEKINLADLEREYYRLTFLTDTGSEHVKREMEVSIKAGELVGLIYDAFLKQYKDPENSETLRNLNVLCVRLVFCLYAEDAGIFGKRGMFHDYLSRYDTSHMRQALVELFKVLDQKPEQRDEYLEAELAEFPYVNGGLFEDENIKIPPLTDEIRELLLEKSSDDFDWSEISPTIFGAVFESTLNPETRRKGGMHYTSIENIHKVIDPLFLDALKNEFEDIKEISIIRERNRKLQTFQNKLASLNFLDPAAGSGNFLTETYISLRRLENNVLELLLGDQIRFGDANDNPIKISISQFYGIEINDFAVTVAKTALWIAESQMMKETETIIRMPLDFLPLKTNANIIEGNALRLDWNEVAPKEKLSYIMGNPPFVGSSIKGVAEIQKEDKEIVLNKIKSYGKLDYVACWYKKAFDYIQNTDIEVAYVSTNSITQGEQVRPMWEHMLSSGLFINFAYRTFFWDSEASEKAHVHCVIISVSMKERKYKYIYANGVKKQVQHINGYLIDAQDFYISSRTSAPDGLPKLTQGNKPWDDGGLILTTQDKDDYLKKYPQLSCCIKKYLGSREFINNIDRYCFWFLGVSPSLYRNIPEIKERLNIVVNIRLASPTKAVQQQASTPALFSQIRQPNSNYILIPETSSSSRRYIPMGFLDKDIIVSNSVMTAENASLYMFGILESNVHMAWVKTICGRMKSDYRYSPALYNNFPWCTPTDEQKSEIENTAQAILDARALYPDCSLADLYDELTMPPELRKAHQNNDRAVMKAYGFPIKGFTESDCVAELMKLYKVNTK